MTDNRVLILYFIINGGIVIWLLARQQTVVHTLRHICTNYKYNMEEIVETHQRRWAQSIEALENTQGKIWNHYAKRARKSYFEAEGGMTVQRTDDDDVQALESLEDWIQTLIRQELGLSDRLVYTTPFPGRHHPDPDPAVEIQSAIQQMVEKELSIIQAQIDLIWEDLEEE